MEKQFQFTSKWSNIDSGLKAGPGGLQTQETSLSLGLSLSPSLPSLIYLCLHIDFLYLITRFLIIYPEKLLRL